jgi:reversibly glycosylated polypeptide/UDP-arabinopyranose mutase
MNALVLATNRKDAASIFLKAWSKELTEVRVIVVHDSDEKVDRWYSWHDLDTVPKKQGHIFSRQDSAIKSYGFLQAYRAGAQMIVCLDDDCMPAVPGGPNYLMREHRNNLFSTPRWCSSIKDERLRGIPYKNLGLAEVGVSMGLWYGTPDLDAPHMLTAPRVSDYGDILNLGTRVMPSSQYFPFCGMNFAFKRELTPLMYFPKMGLNSPYGRFDDIWCGIILQKVCRHLGIGITVGSPMIHHSRASNPFNCLVKEAPGIRDNESLWEMIDGIPLLHSTVHGCVRDIAGEFVKTQHTQYVQDWGHNLYTWLELLGDWT